MRAESYFLVLVFLLSTPRGWCFFLKCDLSHRELTGRCGKSHQDNHDTTAGIPCVPRQRPGSPCRRQRSRRYGFRSPSMSSSPPPSSSSRRELISQTLLLGAVAAGAILAQPHPAAAAAAAAGAAPPSTASSSSPSAGLLQDSQYARGRLDAGPSVAPSSGRSGLLLPAVGARTKRIFLARHGQTDLNKLEVCQGRKLNPSLNEKGRGQARALLASTELGAIVCSPLRRARETAGIVLESHSGISEFSVTPDLKEVDFGGAEGLPKLLAAAVLAPSYFSWSKGRLNKRAGRWGESGVALRRRADAAAGTLLASCEEGGQVLGVSHSSMIKFTLAALLDVPLGTIRTLGQDNCAVNAIDFDTVSGTFEAVMINGRPARGRAGDFGR
ncbi:unnamed protein product [Scytosiphon promiscuus]